VVRLGCPCRVSRYEPGQLLPLRLGAAFRELAWSEIVSGSVGAEALALPLSADRPAGRLVFPVGSALLPKLWGGFRSVGGSGRPRVDLVTEPLLRRQRAGSRGPSLAGWARRSCWSGLDSSLGVQRSPLRRYECCASTPGWAEARPLARRRQPPSSFRPCRSTRLRRFSPLSTLQVYCTLQPAMGFAMFLGLSLPRCPKAAVARSLHPRWRRPFGAFPSLTAAPCHHGPCPLAVPRRLAGRSVRVAARFPSGSSGQPTSGLCSARESVADGSALPPSRRSLLPWVFVLPGSRASGPGAAGSEEQVACRCRSGGPRRGRRAGGGAGPSRLVAPGLRRAPWCVAGRRGCSEERPWCSGLRRGAARGAGDCSEERPRCYGWRRCLQTPAVSGSPPPRRGLVGRARGPASRPPERGWSVGPGEGLLAPFRRRASGGPGGVRGRCCRLAEAGRWRAASAGPAPRRGLGSRRPPVGFRASRSKPLVVRSSAGHRPSEEGRALRMRGDCHSPGATVRLPRRSGAVGSAYALPAPKRWWGVCGSASALPAPKRWWCVCGGPSAASPRPRRGLGCPVRRRVPLFRRARRPSGVPALPKRGGADTLCRCSVGPEGRRESLPCRSAAGPARPRSTEAVRGPWARRSGSGGVRLRLPAGAAPLKAARRSAWSSSPVRGPKPGAGRLPVAGRSPGGEGASPLGCPAASRRAGERGLSSFRNAPGRRLRSGESWNHIP
jgi:hypothetical protein